MDTTTEKKKRITYSYKTLYEKLIEESRQREEKLRIKVRICYILLGVLGAVFSTFCCWIVNYMKP